MLQTLAAVLSKITTTNIATMIVGLTCIILLLTGKKINRRFKKKLPVPVPMEIIVVSQIGNSMAKLYGYSKAKSYLTELESIFHWTQFICTLIQLKVWILLKLRTGMPIWRP